MQYDSYREKVKRVAGILGKLYARRFIILIALVAMAAITAALVMSRGLLVTQSDCPDEMTYGDRIPFRATFILSKTHYEYAQAGSESWTEGQPSLPGRYRIRAYGKTSFGDKTYTETHELTLLHRDLTLTVANTTVEYGDLPTVKVENLAKGDKATCEVSMLNYGSAHTTAQANVSTLRITDKKGNDRTACYNIRSAEPVTVRFKPRSITVTVQNASKVYDDTVLSYDGYELSRGSLLGGDNLVAVFRDTIIDVGTKTNTPELRVYNGNGYDVTAYYDITVKSGKLTVEKRSLIVQAGSSSFVYAGHPIDFRGYDVDPSTSLADGHRLEVKSASTILDVGTAENVLTFAVRNRSGGDETRNYSVFVKAGTLTVTPRAVSILTESGSQVYDGTDQSYPYVTVQNGVGDDYRAVSPTTRRDVGTSENRMAVEFYRDGKNVTSNYIINGYSYGTLEITPRPLNVKLTDDQKIYDGTPLTAGKFMVLAGLYALPKGHTLTLQATGEVLFGTVPHAYVQGSARVTDERGQDVTKNYTVNVTDGTLTVNPRPITVSSESGGKIYDGKPLSKPNWSIISGSLLSGHELSVVMTGVSITDVGTAVNTINQNQTRIFDKRTGEDVTQYYEITYSEGILEITGRSIAVTTPSGEWMYDGKTHRGDTAFEIVEGSLLAGHTAEVASADGMILNVGTAPNSLTVRIMNDEWDVTHNYEISYAYGTLTVTKRPIKVRVESITLTYDGKPHSATALTLAADSLPLATPSQELRVRIEDTLFFTDAGGYINDPAVSVYDASVGMYVTANYAITRYDGTVTIEKRPLHIQLNGEKIYDGKPMDASCYRFSYLNDTSPAPDHTVYAQPQTLHRGAASTMESSIEQSSLTIRDSAGKDVRKNYDVTFYKGTLTVKPRPISVVTASASKTYDGRPLTAYTLSIAPGSMQPVEGDEVVMVVTGSRTEPGISTNTCVRETFGVRNSMGFDTTANYELVSVTEGELTVRYDVSIRVTTGSAEKSFDGLPLTCPDYTVEVIDGSLPNGYTVNVLVTGSVTRPGSAHNTATATVTDAKGQDVTHLVSLTYHLGVLTVTGDVEDNLLLGKVYSDKNGVVYLRMTSYGDFNGQGWNPATPYSQTLPNGYSLNFLPATALSGLGSLGMAEKQTLRFSQMKVFMLPYYTAIGSPNPTVGSDIDYTAVNRSEYDVTYYPVGDPTALLSAFYALPSIIRPGILGEYRAHEAAYRTFVHSEYLTLDEETRAFMNEIIASQGFRATSSTVIGDVAAYIRSAARYNLQYDPALDSESNVAISFLRDYKEGVCTHYATAATLLYRALGIPARYTVGFMMDVMGGEWNEIRSPGHAWVEVYVDGLGWVQVEVTGSADTPVDPPVDPPVNPPVDPDDPPAIQKPELILIPAIRHKTYDGTPLYAPHEIVLTPALEALLNQGYTYTVTVSGSRTEVGDGVSLVASFTLYDAEGRDVTDNFRVVKESGLLRVTQAAVEVMLYPVIKSYDGRPAVWGEGDYTILSLPQGMNLSLTVTLPADKLGNTTLADLNRSAGMYATYRLTDGGRDVTANYTLVFKLPEGMEETPVLTVNPRSIELTAASDMRPYNGEALTNSTVYVTKGSLAAGHTLFSVATGSQTDVGESANSVGSVTILDAHGNDMTSLYSIRKISGKLTVTGAS